MALAFDRFAAGDALDYEVVKQSPDAFEVNVTECRYAKFYKEIGAPALGFLLTCGADFPMAEGFSLLPSGLVLLYSRRKHSYP